MKVGITILSGLVGEFVGWEPTRAWDRAVEMGPVAERLGFSYAWVPDHLQVVRGPADGPTFEAFTLLSAIAVETHRIRLGPGVACAAFRNPALLVKMAMTLDVASNGRVDLAMGAGWHEGEWRGYGYGYPSAGERLALLREALEVVSEIREWLPIIRQRCEEIDRDPATLALSAEIWWKGSAGEERVDRLGQIANLGLARIHSHFRDAVDSDEPLVSFAKDCRAAGIEIEASS